MKSIGNGKKAIFTLLIIAGIGLSFFSCKKDNAATNASVNVTEADAAELATDAVSPSTGGMVIQVNSAVNIYKTVTLSCGVQKDSAIVKASVSGAVPSYSYALSWNYILDCPANQLTFNFTGNSSFDGPRMSSSDKSTGGFVLGGLQGNATTYTLNANYTRNGSQISKIARQYQFTSSLNIQVTNISIDKVTQQIISGSGTVTITGTSSSGSSFSFNGTVTFLGGNKANLVLNSGITYVIEW